MGNGMFKGSFLGGFKKKDVLNYIEELESGNKEREDRLAGEKNMVSRQLEELKKSSSAYAEKIRVLESGVESANAATVGAVEEKQRFTEELDRMKEELANKSAQLDIATHDKLLLTQRAEALSLDLTDAQQGLIDLKQELEGLQQEIAGLHEERDALRAKLIEENRDGEQIAKVMLDARKSADAMMDEAKNRSDKMLSEAKTESDKMRTQTVDTIHKLSESVASFGKEALLIREQMLSFVERSDSALSALSEDAENVRSRLENAGSEVAVPTPDGPGAEAAATTAAEESAEADNESVDTSSADAAAGSVETECESPCQEADVPETGTLTNEPAGEPFSFPHFDFSEGADKNDDENSGGLSAERI